MHALALFAWQLTHVDTAYVGRAVAAYGGAYITASVLWLWTVEEQKPTMPDLVGAGIGILGSALILIGSKLVAATH